MRLSVPLVASLAMLAFALILTPGCGPSDKIQTYTVPKEQEPEPKAAAEPEKKGPYRLLGAIIPDEPGYSRFVKFLGPASKIDPYEKEFDEFLSSIRPSADPAKPFEFKAPANAQPGSPSQMRLATFLFGTDKEPAELYISNPFGGTLLENVNRWLDDVGAPNVKQEELNGVVKEFQIGTVKAYRVEGRNMTDAILDEIERQRAEFAERHQYNVASMFESMYEWQRQSGLEFVSFPPRKPESWQLERARQVLGNALVSSALDKSA